MFKKSFLAAAFVLASSPAFVSAQDFFFSFDENSRVANQTVGPCTTTGTAFIFANENLEFNQLDLDFTVGGVASMTGVTTFNAGGKFTQFNALDPNDPSFGPTATDGRLFAVSFLTPGQVPGSNDADFRPGANGFLLAEVEFDIAAGGGGTANFDFIQPPIIDCPGLKNPVLLNFQNGTLIVEAVPEPSSATLLILGAAGMVARRRRS